MLVVMPIVAFDAYLARAGKKTKVRTMLKLKLAILGAISVCGVSYAATPTAPSLKPPVSYASSVVTSQDATIFHNALRDAETKNWDRLRSQYRTATNPAISDFILWRLATGAGTLTGFETLDIALTRLETWPQMSRVRAYAEEAIGASPLSANERVGWFDARGGAITGEGMAVYARALSDTGQQDRAADIIRKAWRTSVMSLATERALLSRYGSLLSTNDHEARANFLLWGGSGFTSAASRLRSRVSPGYRALIDARVALISRRGSGIDSKINAVPASLKNDPGLLFDRARWRRRKARNQSGATSLLVQINGADVPANGRDNLWDERNIAIRAAFKTGDHNTAYRLAAPHGMTEGGDFADAEWTAGWIALRMLDDAERAAQHFNTLRGGVSTPISLSRADYWYGRALEQMGETAKAQEAYRAAAVHNYAYYGQLAAERISQTQLILSVTPEPSQTERDAFRDRSIIKVLRLLGEAGERGMFRRFAYHVDDQLQTATEQVLFSEIGAEYQYPDIGVRGGKAGLGRGIIAPEVAYPIVSFPLQREVQVENALVLALSRQESELNPRAISSANARGLMQMLPSTAREQARRERLPYRTSWLTDDPGYNMTLGASHLDDLLGTFNGSYIMTAAAYNAGASRPKKWVVDYGDPRKGEIDPVDWVEFIPFSETRNYVQRVLENVQVYRHRLSGQATQIRISADLERGKTP